MFLTVSFHAEEFNGITLVVQCLGAAQLDGTASSENQICGDSTGGEMPLHSMAAFFAMFSYFFFWMFVFRGMKHYAADFKQFP